jgi:hypothetical protein
MLPGIAAMTIIDGNEPDGTNCVFPFKYRTIQWNSCIETVYGQPWCATTADFDADGRWGYCSLRGSHLVTLVYLADVRIIV